MPLHPPHSRGGGFGPWSLMMHTPLQRHVCLFTQRNGAEQTPLPIYTPCNPILPLAYASLLYVWGKCSPVPIRTLHGRSVAGSGVPFGAMLQDFVHGRDGGPNLRSANVVMSHRPHGAFHEGDHEDPLGLERDRKGRGREVRLGPARLKPLCFYSLEQGLSET